MRRIAHLRLVLTGSTRGCICWVERRIKMCRTHHIWIVNNPLYYPSTAVCSAPCQLNESGTDCSPSGKITHPLLKAWQILERVLVQFKWCTHAHVNPGCITLLYRRSLSQSKRRAEMYIWKSRGDGYRSNCRKAENVAWKGKKTTSSSIQVMSCVFSCTRRRCSSPESHQEKSFTQGVVHSRHRAQVFDPICHSGRFFIISHVMIDTRENKLKPSHEQRLAAALANKHPELSRCFQVVKSNNKNITLIFAHV